MELKKSLDSSRYDIDGDTPLSIFISNMNMKFSELENLKFSIDDKKKFDYLYNALPEELVIKSNLINYKEKTWEEITKYIIEISQLLKRLKERKEKYNEIVSNNVNVNTSNKIKITIKLIIMLMIIIIEIVVYNKKNSDYNNYNNRNSSYNKKNSDYNKVKNNYNSNRIAIIEIIKILKVYSVGIVVNMATILKIVEIVIIKVVIVIIVIIDIKINIKNIMGGTR